ncbi:GLUG motif-containing protein [Cupriavidus sp. CV2]|nr:GLUG motif-containing protein [Cupriavidus sp. CV2]
MNKSYALVWNQALGCWNVASELTRRRSKAGRGKVVIAAGISLLGLLGQAPAFALPTGSTVVSGSGTIQSNGQQMTIDQRSDKLVTNWNEFSVGAAESVTFRQPGSNSIALNRVIGNNGSDIQGRIDANGKVFLVNPNGVVFGKTAQVNVGGLVASTQNISDKDFVDGNYRFAGRSTAAVSNAGTLTAAEGGSVALLGARVSNNGVIQAQMGSVALGAGNDFSINFDGNGLLNLQVNSAAVDALAQNGGLLKADGGQVLMTARGADSLLKTVVNNEGTIEARTLQSKSGRITLDGGDAGVVRVAGRLDASALGGQGNGGVVDSHGARVEVQLATQVDTRADGGQTGTWKIRSKGVSVAETASPAGTGSVAQSPNLVINGGISGNVGVNGQGASNGSSGPTLRTDTLSSNLATTNIELASSEGNLSVDGPVSWDSGNKLGLTAERGDLLVNGALTASGANAGLALSAGRGDVQLNDNVALTGEKASLALNYGKNGYFLKDGKAVTLSGKGASFSANGQSYEVVQNLAQLRQIEANMAGRYVLGNRIAGNNASFRSIGNGDALTGTLDGLGNTISDLSVYGTGAFVGLFDANMGRISNLNLDRLSVSGAASTYRNTQVGTLAGVNLGTIYNIKAKDVRVTGASHGNTLGGLVGLNLGGKIDSASVSGQVIGDRYTSAMGGLVGANVADDIGIAKITNSRADTSLSGYMSNDPSAYGAGGLVGRNHGGQISNSSSHGSIAVSGVSMNVGGLVGLNTAYGNIKNSSSTASVSGGRYTVLGGLVGLNHFGSVTNSTASGDVNGLGAIAIGGLVGLNNYGAIANASASGQVADNISFNVGGLVGRNNNGSISSSSASSTVKGGANASVGGLVGYNNGSIQSASVTGTTSGGYNSKVGGLVGFNEKGSVTGSSADGRVDGSSTRAIGGLVGHNQSGSIVSSSASGAVRDDTGLNLGGLIGRNDGGDVRAASATGAVTGGANAFVGGLVGHNSGGTLQAVSAEGRSVAGTNSRVGGLVGHNQGTLRTVSASGDVSAGAGSRVGGLVGELIGKVDSASATGNAKGGDGSRVGGLVGVNAGQITSSSASGTVSGGYGAGLGGLVGLNAGSIRLSSASGKIDGSPSYEQIYGGLIGINVGPGRQSLNSVSGEAAKVRLIGNQF